MLTSKLEVLVNFESSPNEASLDKTIKTLKSEEGVTQVEFKDGAFVVETTLPSSKVLDLVSTVTGRRAVLQGFGESQSAVAMVSDGVGSVLGVVRLQQGGSELVVDGSIDGLAPGEHGLHVYETGDLSQGCSSIGSHFNPLGGPHGGPGDPPLARHAGDLGNITVDDNGRATFRIVDNVLKVWDVIGRSVGVTERRDDLGRGGADRSKVDGNSGPLVACGIIARSAGIFQNPKRICACDGVVVWDERDKPLAGGARRDKTGANGDNIGANGDKTGANGDSCCKHTVTKSCCNKDSAKTKGCGGDNKNRGGKTCCKV